jgi:tetratricopeptide (TPR) repeat protein
MLTGNRSAEYYYQLLDKNFPGSPYTLDAQSTLAVEFMNDAQNKVNRYLDCGDAGSAKEKQENYDAAFRLEKAINIVKEDDPEYANTYISRMFFLMASGDYGKDGMNGDISIAFEKAYAALAIDHDKAYIMNRLAQLHLQNNQPDSAVYYAGKATKVAPKWACAFTTLALAQKALTSNNSNNKKPNKPSKGKMHFGIVTGGGLSKPSITSTPLTVGGTSGLTTYSALGVKGKAKIDLGIISQIAITNSISIRPSVFISFDQSNIDFQISSPRDTQTVTVKTTSFSIPIPFIFRLSNKNVAPFISAGPTFSYLMQKSGSDADKVPVKSFDVLGDIGFGVDVGVPKAGIIISPEIKYSRGLLDSHEKTSSIYSNVITKLNRQGFTFSVYLRKR